MALSFQGPTVCLNLTNSTSHMKPTATLLTCSPPVFFNLAVYFIVYPLLHVCVCLSSLPPLLPLAFTTWTSPSSTPTHSRPSSLQPCAPSPTSPDEFPMNVKQAYKAFAAVPRSLAVLEPLQVGRAAWTLPGHKNTSMLC